MLEPLTTVPRAKRDLSALLRMLRRHPFRSDHLHVLVQPDKGGSPGLPIAQSSCLVPCGRTRPVVFVKLTVCWMVFPYSDEGS